MVRKLSNLLGTLSVSRKLMLIYLLDLTSVIFISGILLQEKFRDIDLSQQQIAGIGYVTVLRDGMLRTFLPASIEERAQIDDVRRLETVRAAHDAHFQTRAASIRYQAALEQWQTLPAHTAYGPSQSAIAQRDAVLSSGRNLLTTVGNQSKLIMDPDLDSYYVMSLAVLRFPEVLQLVHDTTRFFNPVKPISGPAWTYELLSLVGRIDAILHHIERDYQQASLTDAVTLRATLLRQRQSLQNALRQLQALLQGIALSESPQSMADVAAQQVLVLRILNLAWFDASDVLKDLIQQRIDSQYTRLWMHLATVATMLALIWMLVALVARQISQPLQHLVQVANTVRSSGNHHIRARWNSQDEIGALVQAFNEMLTQMDQDRLHQQELAASARAIQVQRALVTAFPSPIIVTSIPKHKILHANGLAKAWLADEHNDPWSLGLESSVRARFFQQLADQGEVNEFEVHWRGPSASLWAVLSARRLQFHGQDALLTVFTPVNALKQMEQKLELWAKVFEASSEGIIIMNAEHAIVSVNRALCRSTQYDYYELIRQPITILLHSEDAAASATMVRSLQEKGFWQGEVRLRRRNGESYPAWLMISCVREGREGTVSNYIGITVDITDRKLNEERIQYLAQHDTLTELPNRALCIERLQQALQQARDTHENIAVLFIDLDRFKIINDTLGHHIGDGLLQSVARRLSQAVRNHDTVSRLGGDEFVILMRHVASREVLKDLVEQRLIPLIRQSHVVERHELQVSCSVGIALYPDDGADMDELMRRADAAMYEAKTSGRDMARFYSIETDRRAQARQSMEQLLRRALGLNEFSVHYQPRIATQGHTLQGVEVLLRWNNPQLGSVPPSEFISVAEESGIIRSIGAWVLEQACAQWQRWQQLEPLDNQKHPLRDAFLSVNLSVLQLADPQLVPEIQALLGRYGMPANRLELEITESQIMDNAHLAAQQLGALKALGVQLSIDDFGTGYSSLTHLKHLKIDRLKIDKSFVQNMASDAADLAITRAIIALGHTLGLTIVAEGVENLDTANMLKVLACEELQGYYFSTPLSEPALLTWVEKQQKNKVLSL
jgi:diguanylate cyclase (GGDEF)-like protein/PAS domain S-box-containing protein